MKIKPIDIIMPVGTMTTVSSALSSLLLHAIPILQAVSLIISIVVGCITLYHYLKKK